MKILQFSTLTIILLMYGSLKAKLQQGWISVYLGYGTR